jgi:SnoaL-like domain
MNLDHWQHYATCWSAPAEMRVTELPKRVAATVLYRDPQSETAGIDGLDAYMAGFQTAFPGHRFEIISVEAHHNRSLARWHQVDGDGAVVMAGASAAAHDADGRMVDITGYFFTG